MLHAHDAFLTPDAFDFQMSEGGTVQVSFGPTHICMNLDSAYELQYRLASFLAQIELEDYADEDVEADHQLCESHETLVRLATPVNTRKFLKH
jgi:hypothetical protein